VKVMIVDDNAEMRTLVRSLLSAGAHEFVECASGEEGVARFATERPDWTVMDVVMPGLDGLTATRRIKAQFPEARVLVITQHHNLKLRDSAREAGATGFLAKDQLIALESILTGNGAGPDGGLNL
jgi:CheY-like chemotaxis protein